MRKPVWAGVVVLATLLMAVGAARAAEPRAEKAREHFQQGDTYFKLEKYANALQEFEQAYLAKQDPSFLYNIAQCHRLMGNRVEAIRFYKRYVSDAPAAANRGSPRSTSATSKRRWTRKSSPAHMSPGAGAPASPVCADRRRLGPAQPRLRPSRSTPGAPPPTARCSATATAAPTPPQTDDRPIYTKWWFWTAVGGVVVGGIARGAAGRAAIRRVPTGRTCQ